MNHSEELMKFLQKITTGHNRIENVFNFEVMDVNIEEKTAIFEYEITEFMLNAFGCLHGGITATILDRSMGLLCSYLLNGQFTPTINLSVNYLLPIQKEDKAVVHVRIERLGRHVCSTTASVYLKSTNECAATATGNFSVVAQ
ncbi:hypothetical protein P261_00743 [Lachnospiraceae bacterium TWA4]|nr:hypothetical protein P261_00743 [Lachnospiraceae bacterium TWA4]